MTASSISEKKIKVNEIALFSIGLFIKLSVLHNFMGIENGFVFITFKNFLVILSVYCLANFANEKHRINIFLVINIFLSALFFVDIMYYSHFFTLMPVHSIYQIKQVGPVSESIFAVLRPIYLLCFADSLLLWIYYKRIKGLNIDNKTVYRPIIKRRVYIFALFIMIIALTGMTYQVGKTSEGNFTPYNLGAINYHLYDMINYLTTNEIDEKAEEFIQDIDNGSNSFRGFAMARNKNVIVIQAESLQSFVIDRKIEEQEITPVLNDLINSDSYYFNRYYEQVGWGNTSDAEFTSHNGFYPCGKTFSYQGYQENEFNTLPLLLQERGYSTIAFHGNEPDFWNRSNIYDKQGLETYISLEEFNQDEMIGIGLSDGSLFRQSIDILKDQPEPFYAFYVTLTSHHPFTMEEKYKGLNIEGAFKNTYLEDYLQSVHYLDKEIGNFIDRLKAEGLYDDTLIVIYGDHQGLDMRNDEVNELLTHFLGRAYTEDEAYRVPFIVHMSNSKWNKEIATTGGQIDFFPTMGNLLGLRKETSMTLGKDLLNSEDGFSALKIHLATGSFIDNEKVFIMANDGIFENSLAWDLCTGENLNVEACREGYERVLAEYNLSQYIFENNLIPLVKEKGLEYVITQRSEP